MRPLLLALAMTFAASTGRSQSPVFGPDDPRAAVREEMRAIAQRNLAGAPAPESEDPGTHVLVGPPLAAELDDSIPLPKAARYQSTPQGDALVEPAAGDPFFLGFAGGSYYPPRGERIDPKLAQRVARPAADERPQPTLYAYVMFEKRITRARVQELESAGARVISFHPHYCLAVALPPSSLEAIASMDFVHWIGEAREWQKLSPAFTPGTAPLVEVNVSVFESDLNGSSTTASIGAEEILDPGSPAFARPDGAAPSSRVMSNGWQQHALEQHGFEALEWLDGVRVLRGRVAPARLAALSALDFVRFVEPVAVPSLAHDESIPMINADSVRVNYTGGSNQSVVGGICDTGLDSSHVDFAFTLYGHGADFTNTTGAFWDDQGHGTHVGGTMCGDGFAKPQLRGVAPGLASQPWTRLFCAKILNSTGGYAGGSLAGPISFFQQAFNDGTFVTPVPHFVNNSWGSYSTNSYNWIGSETNCQLLDNAVYNSGQLWIFASGNEGGPSHVRMEAGSKNVLAVGSVYDYHTSSGDPGVLDPSSGQGPMGDGRWKPNVCAPGNSIESVRAHSINDYIPKAGTSMATPHVSGVVAQLLDKNAWMQYVPEAVQSLLMASAVTKDNHILTVPGDAHLNQYGAGRVDAWKAVFTTQTLYHGTAAYYLPANNWQYGDFTIFPGCTRMVICMNYSEPAASSGASQALVNNFDLGLDQAPIDPNGWASDYVAHMSSLNNTEIRIIDNPQVGAWRWKTWPTNTTGGVYMGVSLFLFYDTTTPAVQLSVTSDKLITKRSDPVVISATLHNPSTIASAAYIEASSVYAYFSQTSVVLADAVQALWGAKLDIELGDIVNGATRGAQWTTKWFVDGLQTFNVQARGDNFATQNASVQVLVDGTPPSDVQNFHYDVNGTGWTNQQLVTTHWDPAFDQTSGVVGYSLSVGVGAPAAPDETPDVGNVTTWQWNLGPGVLTYFSIRAVDAAGNVSVNYPTIGPLALDLDPPTAPQSVSSSSHVAGGVTCNLGIVMNWQPATDPTSAILGYSTLLDQSGTSIPGTTPNLPASATSQLTTVPPSWAPYYFHIRAIDYAGNAGPVVHAGPYYAGGNTIATYCTPKVNSQGCVSSITTQGAPSLSSYPDNFHVRCTNALNNKGGLLFWGLAPNAAPFQGGTLCCQPPLKRCAPLNSGGNPPPNDCSGVFDYHWTQAYSASQGLASGTNVYCQFWYRDPASTFSTGLSNALQFLLCQ